MTGEEDKQHQQSNSRYNYPDRNRKESRLTDFARLLITSHEDLAVGALADDAFQFVLLHALHAGGLRLRHLT